MGGSGDADLVSQRSSKNDLSFLTSVESGDTQTQPAPVVTSERGGRNMLQTSHRRMTPDESNFREWCKPERKTKNACIF